MCVFFCFKEKAVIRDVVRCGGLGKVYKRQPGDVESKANAFFDMLCRSLVGVRHHTRQSNTISSSPDSHYNLPKRPRLRSEPGRSSTVYTAAALSRPACACAMQPLFAACLQTFASKSHPGTDDGLLRVKVRATSIARAAFPVFRRYCVYALSLIHISEPTRPY